MKRVKFVGYTLVEVLVSLSIMGVILGVGFMSYRDLSRRQNISGSVRQVLGDLRFLQNDSLAGRKPTGCTGTLNSYNFRVIAGNPITTYVLEAECSGPPLTTVIVKQASLPVGTYFNALPVVNPIRFKTVGDGTNIVSGQSVILTIAGSGTAFTQTVNISFSGNAQ